MKRKGKEGALLQSPPSFMLEDLLGMSPRYGTLYKAYRLTAITVYKQAQSPFILSLLGSHSRDLLYLWEDQND